MNGIKSAITLLLILGQQPLAFGRLADVPAGKSSYIWTNEKGFVDASKCTREVRPDLRFRIANDPDDPESTQYETLLDSKGASKGKKVSRRSLVRIMGDQPTSVKVGSENLDIEEIEIIGVQPGLKGKGVAERNDAGYLASESLDPVTEYMIQLTDEVTLTDKDSNDKIVLGKIPGTDIQFVDGLLEAETQDNGYLVFKCDGRDYNVFNLHIGSPNDPVAQIGIYWDETKVLRNINVMSLDDGEVMIGENQKAYAAKKAAERAAHFAELAAKYAAEHQRTDPNAINSLTNQPYSNVNGSAVTLESAAVCTQDETGSVFMRNENIDVISDSGNPIKIPNGDTIGVVTKAQPLEAAGRTYVQIEYKGQRGFISSEFVTKSKATCPSLNVKYICTVDGDPLSVRDDGDISKVIAKIDNLTKIGLFGTETRTYNNLKFVKMRSLTGDDEGWVAVDLLKGSLKDCASAGTDVPDVGSGGSLVSCLQRELPRTITTRKCDQRNGVCNRSKRYSKSGTKATGQCARFVNNGILRCGGSKSYMGCNATDCGPLLKNAGFKKLNISDPEKAPLGSVIVYGSKCGNPYGHIEIRLKNPSASGKVSHDDYGYFSDYLGNSVKGKRGWWPRSYATSCRPVKGVYFKANQTSREIKQP